MKVNVSGNDRLILARRGRILVQQTEGNTNYLEQINRMGRTARRLFSYPSGNSRPFLRHADGSLLEFPGRRRVLARDHGNSVGQRSPAPHLHALLLNEVVHGREVPVCVCGGSVAKQSGAKPGDSPRSGGKPARSSSGRYRAAGRTERGSGSGIGWARSPGAGERPRALCLGEHHGPPEPLPNLAALAR